MTFGARLCGNPSTKIWSIGQLASVRRRSTALTSATAIDTALVWTPTLKSKPSYALIPL